MIVLDKLLVGGIKFVLDKLATAADAELSSPDSVRQELLAAQLQLELGEISSEEFARIEGQLLSRLRELRGGGGGAIGAGATVEVDVAEQRDTLAAVIERPAAKKRARKRRRKP